MNRVAILADSTCCIPAEVLKELDIRLIPLPIIYQGKTYLDGIDLTPTEVYHIMRRRQDLPSTSTPSAGDFLKNYEELGRDTDRIVCLALTSFQSKIYEIGLLAKNMAKETLPGLNIEVIDTRAVAGAFGFVVIEAARAAQKGLSIEEVVRIANETIPRVNLLAMVDTLWYLARTGRIARAAAWAGSILNMKPVVEHSPAIGEMTPVARPRTKEKAINLMLKLLDERIGGRKARIMVHHADEPEEAAKLKAEVARRFDCEELYLTEFTPSMGIHAGPGILGFSSYV